MRPGVLAAVAFTRRALVRFLLCLSHVVMLLFLPEGATRCFSRLDDARALAGAGRVFVLDALKMPPLRADACGFLADDVPPEAILNLRPYLPAAVVPAAGGYVVRRDGPTAAVLTIYRRGVWDLPKGKHDAWESDEACALREVREEIGIGDLALLAPLGSTLHGYAEKRRFAVKPTAWFAMRTRDDDHLALQAEEDIADAAWTPVAELPERLGYPTLQAHARLVAPILERLAHAGYRRGSG